MASLMMLKLCRAVFGVEWTGMHCMQQQLTENVRVLFCQARLQHGLSCIVCASHVCSSHPRNAHKAEPMCAIFAAACIRKLS